MNQTSVVTPSSSSQKNIKSSNYSNQISPKNRHNDQNKNPQHFRPNSNSLTSPANTPGSPNILVTQTNADGIVQQMLSVPTLSEGLSLVEKFKKESPPKPEIKINPALLAQAKKLPSGTKPDSNGNVTISDKVYTKKYIQQSIKPEKIDQKHQHHQRTVWKFDKKTGRNLKSVLDREFASCKKF